MPSLIHIIAAAGYITARRRAQQEDSTKPRRWLTVLNRAWRNEITICANQQKSEYAVWKVPYLAVALNVAAGILGFLHVIIGIMIFSGLFFVSTFDTFSQIIGGILCLRCSAA
jgi:hypothetical protein